ncbi:MAG: hypothetical protein WCJ35_22730 [Planctomycetota bacterium]
MTAIRVTITLPHHLAVPDGEYVASPTGESIHLEVRVDLSPEGQPALIRTSVSSCFDAADGVLGEAAAKIASQQARSLLRHTNRLLRWYRQLASRPAVLEVTRAQLSPFRFMIDGTGTPWSIPVLEYERNQLPMPAFASVGELGSAVRGMFATGNEPDVADLTLLDGEHAMNVGRFREAVLLCWSVIDSSFVRKFSSLVDGSLAGEWVGTRDFLKGFDFGLRHKMTSGLRMVAGRSLFDEPEGFWGTLSASYDKRNAIIHKGQSADEDDARHALDVARRIVQIVGTL